MINCSLIFEPANRSGAFKIKILDEGAQDIAADWSNISFDGYPVVPVPVLSDGRSGDIFKSASYICNHISSSQKA